MQIHFYTHITFSLHEKVSGPHPHFNGAKWVFNSLNRPEFIGDQFV